MRCPLHSQASLTSITSIVPAAIHPTTAEPATAELRIA